MNTSRRRRRRFADQRGERSRRRIIEKTTRRRRRRTIRKEAWNAATVGGGNRLDAVHSTKETAAKVLLLGFVARHGGKTPCCGKDVHDEINQKIKPVLKYIFNQE